MRYQSLVLAASLFFAPSFAATCIPWVGGAQEYVAWDCVTLDGTTYYAQRPVNAWTPPTDTWHWTTTAPTIPPTVPTTGNVVLDPLATAVSRGFNEPVCPTTKTYPLSEQSYTVQKDGLFVVNGTLLVAQLSAGEGRFFLEINLNGTSTIRQFPYLVEPYSNSGHYREANGRNQVEVHAGDQITVKTSMSNTWVNIGEYVNCTVVTVENVAVSFYEGGKLLSATTSLQRQ